MKKLRYGELGRETFLLLFVLGSGVLAIWFAVRFPALAPASIGSAGLHLVAAVLVGSFLGPALHAVPGLPSELSLLVALFAVGLPVITYMLLVGFWLVRFAVGQTLPDR